MEAYNFTCPACGHLVFEEPPGSYAICPICGWEDDDSQLRFPTTTGANHVSLIEAQKNVQEIGASEEKYIDFKKNSREYKKDTTWRPLNLAADQIERPDVNANYFDRQPGVQVNPGDEDRIDYGKSYPKNLTDLYYWKKAGSKN